MAQAVAPKQRSSHLLAPVTMGPWHQQTPFWHEIARRRPAAPASGCSAAAECDHTSIYWPAMHVPTPKGRRCLGYQRVGAYCPTTERKILVSIADLRGFGF